MAFEVFDDVAFYWFFQVLLGIFLIPYTLYRLCHMSWWGAKRTRRKRVTHPVVEHIPDYIPTQRLLSEDEKKIESAMDSRYLSLSNIFFAALWVAFALMLVQLPKWHNREMADFEPYSILSVERGADMIEIKRAYKKQSIKWHPDRNPENRAKAQDMFIMISKAYKALTDPDTREKYEKYGTPDGYQGTEVTIGLPSFFTAKENELLILSLYFGTLIVLVALGVWWWNHANKYHKSGVYKQSIDIYWRYVKHNTDTEGLVDILAASSEYRILDVKIPTTDAVSDLTPSAREKVKDLRALYDEVIKRKPTRGRGKASKKAKAKSNDSLSIGELSLFHAAYAKKANTLLTAHLLGLPIADSLWEEYLCVLQEAPRLLDVMIDMTLSRERFWLQALALMQVKQAIVQSVWPSESRLKQLPHWSPPLDAFLKKKHGIGEVKQLNLRKPQELEQLLTEAYSFAATAHTQLVGASEAMPLPGASLLDAAEISAQVRDAVAMVRMFPFVSLKWCARTYDELEVFEGDVVTVTVKLRRWHEPWNFDVKAKQPLVERMPPPELEEKRGRLERASKSGAEDSSLLRDAEDYDVSHGLDFVDSALSAERRLQILRLNSPVVHVKRFPFRVREKWCVMLVDKLIPAVVDQMAVPALNSKHSVDLHFRVNRKAGRYPYALVCKCDSYLGADLSAEFTLDVLQLTEEETQRRKRVQESAPDYGIQEDGGLFSLEADTKWYYLWNENIWEMFLTIFLLYFIYLILVSTPWGKRYVQPAADWLHDNAVYPLAAAIYASLAPVLSPAADKLKQHTGFDAYNWLWGLDLDDASREDDDAQ